MGFKWNLKDDKFEKGMQETLNYMDQSGGDPNVTTKGCRTKDDHKLRQWQYGLRRSYKNGWLTPDKIQALERIGFRWEVSFLQSQFERGIEESLKCKKIFGDPNVKQSYMTEDSFNLGTWQNTQRRFYKKGKLSPDRIKRLEDIGFKWRR